MQKDHPSRPLVSARPVAHKQQLAPGREDHFCPFSTDDWAEPLKEHLQGYLFLEGNPEIYFQFWSYIVVLSKKLLLKCKPAI